MEKKSGNNNAWTTRKSDTRKNTFAVQDTNNPSTNEMHEDSPHIRNEVVFILKHINGGAKKVNLVNYLTMSPPPTDVYYYKEDIYAVNDHTWGF